MSQTLEILAGNMRADGVDEHYGRDVETQARAGGGLLRGAPVLKSPPSAPDIKPGLSRPPEHLAAPALPTAITPPPVAPVSAAPRGEPGALTRLDRLSTSEKVALFS
ncbi:MAG TPA: hypothetical protein VGB93_03865 [Methylovirgula sp.]